MIDIQQLTFSYQPESLILEELDFKVKTGELIALCGESGCGKSTFLKILNGLIPELYQGQMSGRGTVFHHNLLKKEFSSYVKDLGVVFQNPKTQFFTNDVYSELAFSMENYGVEATKIRERIQEVTEKFQLTDLVNKSMFALSGGQKQLVAFASASMLPHPLFILDEPSSNLDERTIDRLRDYLEELKNMGLTVIVAEHRLYYLKDIVDRYCLVENGKIKQNFVAKDLQSQSKQEIKKLKLRSLTETTLEKQSELILEKEPSDHFLLSCQNLSFHYRKQGNFLHIPSLELDSQYVTGIVGPNGAGKSTFIKLLSGLTKPKSGEIYLGEEKVKSKQLLANSFTVMQDVNLQLFFETVEKELIVKAENRDNLDKIVEQLHLKPLLHRHPQSLSGGEKQRVAIGSGLLSGKKIIVLDEPTSGLDLLHMEQVSQLIKWLHRQNVMILIVTHDKEFLANCCQRVLHFDKGTLKEDFFLSPIVS